MAKQTGLIFHVNWGHISFTLPLLSWAKIETDALLLERNRSDDYFRLSPDPVDPVDPVGMDGTDGIPDELVVTDEFPGQSNVVAEGGAERAWTKRKKGKKSEFVWDDG